MINNDEKMIHDNTLKEEFDSFESWEVDYHYIEKKDFKGLVEYRERVAK